MQKFQCLLFVLMRSYIFCYITCTTVPLILNLKTDISVFGGERVVSKMQ